jgi:DNA-directed RNA polymerase specialized sigma24 family protein
MNTNSIGASMPDPASEATWQTLYPALRSHAQCLVYSFRVRSWRGQEEDIIEDVVQETARRVLERSHKAERGEADQIYSLKNLTLVTAHNYCADLRRHDRRLSHVQSQESLHEANGAGSAIKQPVHPLELVTEHVFQEWIFGMIAHEVSKFPEKQRTAVLIDLANRMSFDAQPTPLQQAFLNAGIQLQQYKQELPSDPQARNRHLASLSQAYKRIAHLPCVQQYVLVA